MATSQSILSQVAVELRYARGMVYLDRCGSIYTKMADELGAAFVAPTVPNVESTDFSSPDELLSVRFGPKNLAVIQQWVNSPARVEQVAAKAWAILSDALEVKTQVLRCGMRIITQWSVASVDDGSRMVLRVAEPAPAWKQVFGAPVAASLVTIQREDGQFGSRAELSVVQQKISNNLPANLATKISPIAVQLDIDHVLEGSAETFNSFTPTGKPRAVGPGQFKDFMRGSWEATQTAAIRLRELME